MKRLVLLGVVVAACHRNTEQAPASCTQRVPRPVADRYLSSYRLEQHSMPDGIGCTYIRADRDFVSFVFSCRRSYESWSHDIEQERRWGTSPTEVSGIGRTAYTVADGAGGSELDFWDDATSCAVTISATGNELAKDLKPLALSLAARDSRP